jgi:hypothetical protein
MNKSGIQSSPHSACGRSSRSLPRCTVEPITKRELIVAIARGENRAHAPLRRALKAIAEPINTSTCAGFDSFAAAGAYKSFTLDQVREHSRLTEEILSEHKEILTNSPSEFVSMRGFSFTSENFDLKGRAVLE